MGKAVGDYTLRIAVKDEETNDRIVNILSRVRNEFMNTI